MIITELASSVAISTFSKETCWEALASLMDVQSPGWVTRMCGVGSTNNGILVTISAYLAIPRKETGRGTGELVLAQKSLK